ncbi:glycosyltransferase, partial [Candidatus Sumerlaeota bacterium]|nr:glycosyltransferase [Candidatus Sumerlaeota bacterium]
KGIPVHLVPMRGKMDFSVLPSIISILKKERADILQSHTARTHFLARLASIFVSIKKLATVHSPILLDTNIDLRPKKLNYWIERLTARWSDLFVTVSEEGKETLIRQGIPSEKIFVIYNGVDLRNVVRLNDEEKHQLRQELGFSSSNLIVSMIAQLRPRKGAEYFIRAIPHVRTQIPESRFLIVGDAEFVEGRDYLNELKQLAEKLSVTEVLTFTGFRPDADKIMEIVDVLVLPSLFGEGLPLVLIEAMAHGVPVVATNTSGNKEVVVDGETGMLVPPTDVIQLADKLTILLRSPELRRKMGISGRHRVQEKFSLDMTIKSYQSIYRKLMEKS